MHIQNENGFKPINAVQILLGAIIASLGLSVILGYHLNSTLLLQLHPSLTVMVYKSAVCFLLCGAALVCAARQRTRDVALTFGLLLLAISGLTLTEQIARVNFGVDALFNRFQINAHGGSGRMPFNTTISFVCCGAALVLLRFQLTAKHVESAIAAVLGAVVAAFGIVALVGYVMNIPAAASWGDVTRMASQSALGFVAAGAGIVAWAWAREQQAHQRTPRWMPILIFLGAMTITINLYLALNTEKQTSVRATVDASAIELRRDVEVEIRERILALERMATRWATRAGGTPVAEWELDAQKYVDDFPGLSAVGFVDPSFRVKRIAPLAGNEAALNLDLAAEERRFMALDAARISNKTRITRTVELAQGGRGFVIYSPIFRDNKFEGAIAGVFLLERFFDRALTEETLEKYSVTIWDGNAPFYQRDDAQLFAENTRPPFASRFLELDLHGAFWMLQIAPKPQTLQKLDSAFAQIALGGGTIISLLFALAVFLAQRAIGQTRRLRHSNAQLESEMSERQTIEAALKDQRDFVSAVVDTSGALVVVLDRSGRIVRFNNACERVTKYRSEEVWNRVFWEFLILPEEKEFVCRTFGDLRAGHFPNANENYWIAKDGERRFISWSNTAILNQSGEVEFIVGTGIDVTDRKKVEAEQKRLIAILEASPDLIGITDRNDRIVYLNRAGRKMAGWRADEDLTDRRASKMHPEWALQQAFHEAVPHAVKNGSWIGESAILNGENNEIPISQVILPHKNEAGEVEYLSTVARDITEQKRAESELRESESRFRSMADSAPVLIWLTDENRVCNYVNRTWLDFTGRTFDEEIGDGWTKGVPLEDFERCTEIYSRAFDACTAFSMEHRLRRADGENRWMLVTGVPRFTEQNEFLGFIGSAVDITKRRQMQAELEEARDAALESARLKSEFLANMSHEIRTPMNGVIGMTELLLDNLQDSEQREYAETIRQSADALLTIINDILDFSKIEAGKLTFEIIDFDLRETIQTTIGAFTEIAARKNLALNCEIEPAAATAWRGDPGRLRQILNNLIGNAIKFTERGAVSLKVRIENQIGAAARLRFEVSDTGIGIPADAQKRLFQAFVQADGSMTRRFGGTGLGLAISKNLVELMNGEIGVESVSGVGSTFYFVVELEKQLLNEKQTFGSPKKSLPAALESNNKSDSIRRSERILIAEDNPVNQRVARLQLERLGFAADVAENGAQAVAAWESNRYSLILMDCQMPVMDGYAAAAEIRRRAANADAPPTPIVAVTANAMQGERDKCLAAGMDDYLAKPFKQVELGEVLNRWLPFANEPPTQSHELPRAREIDDGSRALQKSGLINDLNGRWSELEEEIGAEMIETLVSIFLEDAAMRVNNLNKLAAHEAWAELEREAHTLKGSCANLGAKDLAKLCAGLELSIKNQDFNGVAEQINRIAASFQLVEKTMPELCGNLAQTA